MGGAFLQGRREFANKSFGIILDFQKKRKIKKDHSRKVQVQNVSDVL